MGIFHCIAVDMGAASIRIMLGTITAGKISYEEISRFKNEIRLLDGHERWDVENFINEINKAITVILSRESVRISSIGIDSWGVDFVLLDKEGKLIDLPVAYRDARTRNMQKKWSSIMSREETFRRTGINFYEFNTLFHLLAIRDEEYVKKIDSILFMPCYVGYRLSGRVFNELTIASTSQMLIVDGKEMDQKILENLNLNNRVFGNILMPGEIAGNVTEGHSLPPDVKMIAVGCHDTASAVFSVPSENSNYAFISAGTWCIVGMVSQTPVLNSFALENGFTNERGYDNTYRILKNIVGLWLVQGLKQSFKDKYTYSEIENLASVAESRSIIIPDNEIFYNPENMKDAFDNYVKQTGQSLPDSAGEYFRIAYDSICCSFRDHLDKLEDMLDTEIKIVHLIGGGGQSGYFCRQTANISGRTVIAGPIEGSTIGNILTQALALKVIPSVKEGKKMIRNSFDIREYHPGKTTHEEIYSKYKMLNNQ
jgi:rhamnulokinase